MFSIPAYCRVKMKYLVFEGNMSKEITSAVKSVDFIKRRLSNGLYASYVCYANIPIFVRRFRWSKGSTSLEVLFKFEENIVTLGLSNYEINPVYQISLLCVNGLKENFGPYFPLKINCYRNLNLIQSMRVGARK